MIKTQKSHKNHISQIPIIDSARFMASLLSNLVDNLAEGIQWVKRRYRHDNETQKTCGIDLEYKSIRDDLIECRCLCCNKNYEKTYNENLKNTFIIIYQTFIKFF